ncbi:MAG: hypothetical protein WDW38_010928 [Sanguina aurantia]
MIQDQSPFGFAIRVVRRFPKTTVVVPLLLFGASLATGAVLVSLNCPTVGNDLFPSYQSLIDKGYSYQLTRPSVSAYNESPGDVVIDSQGALFDPVLRSFTYSTNSTIWSMQVSPQAGWQPGWLAGFQVVVVAFAAAVSGLLGITLLACAAALITAIMDQLLEGVQPSISDVLAVRTVVSRAVNIYRPFDLAKQMQATLDVSADILLPSLRHSYEPALDLYRCLSSSTPGTPGPKHDSPNLSRSPLAEAAPGRRDKQHPCAPLLPQHGSWQEFSTMLPRAGSAVNSPVRPAIPANYTPRASMPGSPSLRSMDGPQLRPGVGGSAARRRSVTARAALQLPLMEEVERCLFASDAWQYDVFELESATDGHALSTLAFYLFQKAGLLQKFKLDGPSLVRFLRAVEDKYRRNPYHCAAHAADVLQSFAVLLDRGGLLVPGDALTLLGCYIAAVGAAHALLSATGDKLAVRYNDISPLENHHLAATFTLLRQPGLDFLAGSNLGKQEQVQLRKLIIELVLASDMSKHFEIVATFQTTFGVTAQADWEPPAEVAGEVCISVMHPAIQNNILARTLALKVGFFDFVAMPLFNIVAQTFPALAPVYRGLIANRSYWKESAGKV